MTGYVTNKIKQQIAKDYLLAHLLRERNPIFAEEFIDEYDRQCAKLDKNDREDVQKRAELYVQKCINHKLG